MILAFVGVREFFELAVMPFVIYINFSVDYSRFKTYTIAKEKKNYKNKLKFNFNTRP